jgi:GDP-4-dehydro-6-deoxy-D-mannose reductase
MRVLVTGASGFVGAHLESLLRSRGHHVTTLSRDGEVDHRVDITEADEVTRAVRAAAPDGIVHLAAVAYVPDAEHDAGAAHAVNVIGTRNVIDAAHAVGARTVFASSGAVYGDGAEAKPPFVESARLGPRGVYAETKAEAEEECLRVRGRQAVVRVRAFNHTGPGQPESYVCSGFSKQVVQGRLGLIPPVVAVGDLSAERDFSDVRDVVRAYLMALEYGDPGEVYNVCSGVPTRIGAILDQLIELAGVRMDVRADPARFRQGEVSRLWGDNTKIRRALGWSPEISLRVTLTDLLGWWQQRLEASAPGGTVAGGARQRS